MVLSTVQAGSAVTVDPHSANKEVWVTTMEGIEAGSQTLRHQTRLPSGKQGGAWATVGGVAMVDPHLTQGMGMCRVEATVDDVQSPNWGHIFSRCGRGTQNVRWDKTSPVDTVIIRKQWQPNIRANTEIELDQDLIKRKYISTVAIGWREDVHAADNTVQKVKVKRSVGWTIKLNVSSGPIPTPLLVCLSNKNPKHSLCHINTEHDTDLNKFDAGWR